MYIRQCYSKDKSKIPEKSAFNSDAIPRLKELLTRLKQKETYGEEED